MACDFFGHPLASLDDFNRADQGPPPSANWTTVSDGHTVTGNEMVYTSLVAPSTSAWNVQKYGPHLETCLTITDLDYTSGSVQLILYFRSSDMTFADVTYGLEYAGSAGSGTLTLFSFDALGAGFVTIDTYSLEIFNGDTIGVSAIANDIIIGYRPAAGAWVELFSVVNSDVPGDGYFGISTQFITVDDFCGESLPTPPISVIAGPIMSLYGTTYSIWLLSPTGTFIKLIARFNRLSYTLAANGIGVCKLTLPPTFPLSFVQEDCRLLIWRQVPGGRKYLDGDAVWLIRDWEESINQQGREEYNLLAYTAPEILDRAIIAYSQGSSQGSKASQPLDNIVKALVRENLGTLATDTARDISAYLVVEADLSLGPSAPKTAPWRKLLPTLRELAQTADDLGTRIFFDVVHGSPLLLRTFKDQRGINHGLTSGQRVILSTRNGTIAQISRSYKSSDERNVIYLGGSSTQIDATRTGASPINRREYFMDAGNMTAAQLTAEGQAALKNYRPKESYSIKLRDTVGIRYGREFGFGDRLAAEVGNRLKEVRLDAVEVVMEGGRETINGDLRVDE